MPNLRNSADHKAAEITRDLTLKLLDTMGSKFAPASSNPEKFGETTAELYNVIYKKITQE